MSLDKDPLLQAISRLLTVGITSLVLLVLSVKGVVTSDASLTFSVSTSLDLVYHCSGKMAQMYRDVLVTAWTFRDTKHLPLCLLRLTQVSVEAFSLFRLGLMYTLVPYVLLRLGVWPHVWIWLVPISGIVEAAVAAVDDPRKAFLGPLVLLVCVAEACPTRGDLTSSIVALLTRTTLVCAAFVADAPI